MQVVDDILDITATTEELGKTAGKDLASEKTTYPALVGLERSREVRRFADKGTGPFLWVWVCVVGCSGGQRVLAPGAAFGQGRGSEGMECT